MQMLCTEQAMSVYIFICSVCLINSPVCLGPSLREPAADGSGSRRSSHGWGAHGCARGSSCTPHSSWGARSCGSPWGHPHLYPSKPGCWDTSPTPHGSGKSVSLSVSQSVQSVSQSISQSVNQSVSPLQ